MDSNRHAIFRCLGAGAFALSLATVSTFAIGAPGGGNADAEAIKEAFEEYLNAVETVAQTLQESDSFQQDPSGMLDVHSGMMITNLMNAINSSGSGTRANRPRWNFFDSPDTRIGIDNPDTRYLAAGIPNGDGNSIFRIWGNRSNNCDMITLVNDPTNPLGGGQTLEDEDMKDLNGGTLELNEDFEIYISNAANYDPAWTNWLQINDSDGYNVSQRYTVCNYHTERPDMNIHIERVGTGGVAITGDEFRNNTSGIVAGIEKATSVMTNQQPFWAGFADLIINSGLPANVMAPWNPTGGLGITSQLSSTSWIDLEDDEALMILVRNDYQGGYGSFMLFNRWGSSLPWGHHMANGSFEVSESQGNSYFHPAGFQQPVPPQLGGQGETAEYTYIFVSKEDPGVKNWMGTMGYRPVFIAGRLQSVLDPVEFAKYQGVGPYMAISQVIPLAAIFPGSPALPPTTQFVTPAERAAQIAERQDYQRDKYAPW